jgi:hypothetical protein
MLFLQYPFEALSISDSSHSVPVIIFSHDFITDVANACLVCKKWASVGTSDEVWRRRVVAFLPDQFSTRAQINELIRRAEQDTITCKVFVVGDDPLSKPHVRLLWREIYFLSVRVTEALSVVNKANSKIAAAAARKQKPRRATRASKNILQNLFARANFAGPFTFSLGEKNIESLLRWMEELIQTLDEIEAGEEEPEPAGIAAAKIFSSFKEDLLSSYFKMSLEFAVQLCRQSHRSNFHSRCSAYSENLGTILGSAMWMSHVAKLGQFAPLVMRQMSRLISTFAESAQLAAVTPLYDMVIEWSTNYGKRIVRSLRQPWRLNGSFVKFLSTCLAAFGKLTDPAVWEKRLVEISKDAENRERTKDTDEEGGQKDLAELDGLISQFFLELNADEATWDFFKLAIEEFESRNASSLDVSMMAVAEIRMLALVGEACPASLERDMDWVISTLLQPALLPHANKTWRRSMCMAVAQLVYDIGDDRAAEHLPRLLSLIMPMLADPEVAEYARSSTINLWSAVQNVNEGDIPRPIATIGEKFVQDVVSVVESRQGDWPAAALALGYSAAALGTVFLPFYDKCLTAIKQGLKSAESSGTKEDLLKLVEAASLIVKLPVAQVGDTVRQQLLELSWFLVDLVDRGIITHKSRATLLAFANLASAMGDTEDARRLVSLSLPPLLSILNTPPAPVDPMGGENMDNFEHTFVDGNFIAVSRSDLQLRVDALDAIHVHIDGCWKNLWGPLWRQTQQAIENVIRNEFNSARLSQTGLVLRDFLEVMFVEISRKEVLSNDRDLSRVAEMEAVAQQSFDSAFDTLSHTSSHSADGSVLSTCAEVISDMVDKIPKGLVKFDSARLVEWITDVANVAVSRATALRGEDGEEEDEEDAAADEADEPEEEDPEEETEHGEDDEAGNETKEAGQRDDNEGEEVDEPTPPAPAEANADDITAEAVEREKQYEVRHISVALCCRTLLTRLVRTSLRRRISEMLSFISRESFRR